MAQIRKGGILWRGTAVDVEGPALKAGDKAPVDFTLAANDMSGVSGKDMAGKPRIVSTVPSLDTPVCDMETRRFNTEAAKVPSVKIYTVSLDLPFAQKRWCGAAGIDKVQTLSDYKDRTFGPAWGVYVPSKGLFARAVFVVDSHDVIRYAEYVKDAVQEPDYNAALEAAKALT
jgi:thioredoxin-dependent peroxiredoxin